jgi:large subunit ribosomal protein L4
MKFDVLNIDGKVVSDFDLNDEIFGVEPRADIISRVVTWQLSCRRSGNHKTKEIGDVRGSTKKIYKQKGTGGARHGSKRGPQFRGGAIIFGPVVRDHGYSLPKKVKKLGMRMAIASKIKEGNLIIVDSLALGSCKLKDAKKNFAYLQNSSALLVDGESCNDNLLRSINLVVGWDALPQIGANVYDIVRKDKLIVTVDAIKSLEARLK